jgi:membrane protease YdiL (CAAX protease family)
VGQAKRAHRVKSTAPTGKWQEGAVVFALVLAPFALAFILVAGGLLATAGWQTARGVSVAFPTRATIQLYGLLAYVAASWIVVAAAWRWSSRRGLFDEVFGFRRLTLSAVMSGLAAFAVILYGVPVATRFLSDLTGGSGPPIRINFDDPRSISIYVLLFVVTTPLTEEILYRGLLVAWLRCAGWNDLTVAVVGSVLFGANHALPLGPVWAVAMTGLGAILYALRLRFASLTPGWLAHVLFNAQPFLIYPLTVWIAPAWLPGHLAG